MARIGNWQAIEQIYSGKHKAKCEIWKVKRSIKRRVNFKEEIGYFKIPTLEKETYIGPIIANEIIGTKLAKKLQLPVADTEMAIINGRKGVVSIEWPVKPLFKWKYLKEDIVQNLQASLDSVENLLQTFIYDIWIINIDRHNRNILVFPEKNKYRFYLIDHGLSLAGAVQFRNRGWKDSYWEQVSQYNKRYVDGLLDLIQDFQQLEPSIKKIELLTANEICDVVDSVPKELLTSNQSDHIKKFLIIRQSKLRSIVAQWLEDKDRGLL